MLKPQVKTVYPPIPLGDGVIRIGGGDLGIASELTDDAQGNLWRLLQLMDGSRTLTRLIEEMRRGDPSLTSNDVTEVIDTLAEAGFLQDAAARPDLFTPAEINRYQRNFDFWSYFHVPGVNQFQIQERLSTARVTVLGLGGLGSYAALALASVGVGDLLLVDHDTVEPSNLNRQVLYTGEDVGRLKTTAAAERLSEVNPHITISTLDARIAGVDQAEDCLRDRDLLVCAADRPRVQIYRWLNRAALATGVPWIRGANGGHTVSLFLHAPGRTACFECEQRAARVVNPHYDTIVTYAMDDIGDRTINPCTAPVAGMIGNMVALEAVKQLTGVAEPAIHGRAMSFDLRTLSAEFVDGHPDRDCPACGGLGARSTRGAA